MACRQIARYLAAALTVGLACPQANGAVRVSANTPAYFGPPPPIGRQFALKDPQQVDPDNTVLPKSGSALELPVSPGIGSETSDDEAAPAETTGTDVDGLPKATISDDPDLLPEPVRRMRQLITAAARSGDPERLRPLIAPGANGTQLSVMEYDGDPIEYLKQNSGDGNGQETLAILLDILAAGYAHVDAGEPTEMFVWPYFYAMPLDGLSDPQMVELFRIVTAGDFEEMSFFGSYIFYRVGITPEGEWRFFVIGD